MRLGDKANKVGTKKGGQIHPGSAKYMHLYHSPSKREKAVRVRLPQSRLRIDAFVVFSVLQSTSIQLNP